MAVSVCRKAEACVTPIKRMMKSGNVELKTCPTHQPARETQHEHELNAPHGSQSKVKVCPQEFQLDLQPQSCDTQ